MNDLTYYCDSHRHLVCYPFSVANLHRMAEDLGIKRSWYHNAKTHPHYDIPMRMVAEVTPKCTLISARQILGIIRGEAP